MPTGNGCERERSAVNVNGARVEGHMRDRSARGPRICVRVGKVGADILSGCQDPSAIRTERLKDKEYEYSQTNRARHSTQ